MKFDGEAFGAEIVSAVKGYVDRETARLAGKIAVLEARVAASEAKGLAYRGVHQKAADYSRGDAVTASGSLWIALTDIRSGEAPGASNNWQLAVKAGRDGKDAR
ncbi:hypothetical protein DLJ53_20745 [Acuticoccus sediminis]|uniref:Uncharacterized protein n=1 Tax=Acuticoccus sediminis TaxID=2184697 RepID=A0A8B2NNF6_9HYPH|nr:hypothetical protein [Acuticoccus sediminis]RAI00141.1 hypothetical protein DLJ53_20745 [Acuticoccus sediminis]